jgi:hypothetical protein
VKAAGYIVIRVDDTDQVITTPFIIDTGPILSVIDFGNPGEGYTEILDDPCHRSLIETIIGNLQHAFTGTKYPVFGLASTVMFYLA